MRKAIILLMLMGCGEGVTTNTCQPSVISVEIVAAVVMNPGLEPCLAPDPKNVTILPGGQIQFYAKVTTTCGEELSPPAPPSWPALCR